MKQQQQRPDQLPEANNVSTHNCCLQECRVTSSAFGGAAFRQNPQLDYSGGAKVIFILGYPHSGTSATHFLLSTSNNVSTLTGSQCLHPSEEGFSIAGIKANTSSAQRWGGSLKWVDWKSLAQLYGSRWNHSRPLKVENSPPEIQVPETLVETFEPLYGKVKFILLVRGDCAYNAETQFRYEDRVAVYQNVVHRYPKDTFVLRFEDLCFHWDAVYTDLVQWEPLLVDIKIQTIPATKQTPQCGPNDQGQELRQMSKQRRRCLVHSATSIPQFCQSLQQRWLSKLANRTRVPDTLSLGIYGYDKTNTC